MMGLDQKGSHDGVRGIRPSHVHVVVYRVAPNLFVLGFFYSVSKNDFFIFFARGICTSVS